MLFKCTKSPFAVKTEIVIMLCCLLSKVCALSIGCCAFKILIEEQEEKQEGESFYLLHANDF